MVAAPERSTVVPWSAPVMTAFRSKLPSRAFDTRSPACTWNAELPDVKASCVFPLLSSLAEAVMLAFLNAVRTGWRRCPNFGWPC